MTAINLALSNDFTGPASTGALPRLVTAPWTAPPASESWPGILDTFESRTHRVVETGQREEQNVLQFENLILFHGRLWYISDVQLGAVFVRHHILTLCSSHLNLVRVQDEYPMLLLASASRIPDDRLLATGARCDSI